MPDDCLILDCCNESEFAYSLVGGDPPAPGNTCTYVLSSESADYGYEADSGSFDVDTQPICDWSAVSDSEWLVTSSTGTGDGTVDYTVALNTGEARTGTITVGGQVFTVNQAALAPPDVPGDWAWWKADAITGYSDGQALATWIDSSGNSHHLVQGVAYSVWTPNGPFYKVNRVNGLPAVNFSFSWFTMPHFFSAFTEGEIFMVMKANVDPNVTVRQGGWMRLGLALGYDFFNDFDNRRPFSSFGSGITKDFGGNSVAKPLLASWNLINMSSKTNEWISRFNGVVTNTVSPNTVAWPAGTPLYLGAAIGTSGPYDDFDEFFFGDIAEIIFYSSVISAPNRAAVVSYLQTKYGL